jgi:hypothetical protein
LSTKKTCRFIIHATGKNGETYLATCQNKWEVKQWIAANHSKVNKKELKIIDKQKKQIVAKNIFIVSTVLLVLYQLYILL